MRDAVEKFWGLKLAACRKALEENGFDAHIVPDPDAARELILETVIPQTKATTVSYGGGPSPSRPRISWPRFAVALGSEWLKP